VFLNKLVTEKKEKRARLYEFDEYCFTKQEGNPRKISKNVNANKLAYSMSWPELMLPYPLDITLSLFATCIESSDLMGYPFSPIDSFKYASGHNPQGKWYSWRPRGIFFVFNYEYFLNIESFRLITATTTQTFIAIKVYLAGIISFFGKLYSTSTKKK